MDICEFYVKFVQNKLYMTVTGIITLMLFDFDIIEKSGSKISKAMFCLRYPELSKRIVSVFDEPNTLQPKEQIKYVLSTIRPSFRLLGFDLKEKM